MLKARVFRFFAVFFAVVGFGIFLLLYLDNIDGQILTALTEPRTLWMVLMPFLPAVILSYISERASMAFFRLVKENNKEMKPVEKNVAPSSGNTKEDKQGTKKDKK